MDDKSISIMNKDINDSNYKFEKKYGKNLWKTLPTN